MDLVTQEDLQKDSGKKFIPDSVLSMMHTDVLQAASDAFSKAVMDNPEFEIGAVRDQALGGTVVYWRRVA
jgi:hypothetical protein